jgi:enterochelin esterase-like enzyme
MPVNRAWTAEELLARWDQEQSSVWVDGDELTFVYQGEADAVDVCCSLQMSLQPVAGSDLWVLTVRIDNLERAVISYSFIPYRNGRPIEDQEDLEEMRVWRGPDAPPAPPRAEYLQGQIVRHTLQSAALGESRDLTVYLPPDHDPGQRYPVVYAADGDVVDSLATIIDPAVVSGEIVPVVVVGVHPGGYDGPPDSFSPSLDLRAQEYLLGANEERFEAHERFFVYEVAEWAEQDLGASTERDQRAVFGFSNGGAFAVSMGIRHPDRYGSVLAFSLASGREGWGTPVWEENEAPRHYLAAGTLEPFMSSTVRWVTWLELLNVDYLFRMRISGHDMVMWEEEFLLAVDWAFSEQ